MLFIPINICLFFLLQTGIVFCWFESKFKENVFYEQLYLFLLLLLKTKKQNKKQLVNNVPLLQLDLIHSPCTICWLQFYQKSR